MTTASASIVDVVFQPSTPASSRSVRAAGASPTTDSKSAGRCGSISTSTAPSDAQRLSIRSRRGSPSASAPSESRMTSGSVHAPPTQPCSSPSAVTSARSPTRAEDGRSTATTVASANGVPSSTRRPASTRTFTPRGRPRSAPPRPGRASSACRESLPGVGGRESAGGTVLGHTARRLERVAVQGSVLALSRENRLPVS